jgi:hypothetical protein
MNLIIGLCKSSTLFFLQLYGYGTYDALLEGFGDLNHFASALLVDYLQ